MRKRTAIELIARRAEDIRSLGVERLYLFGSTARDEANAASDVDVFVDYRNGFSLFELAGLRDLLSDILGTEADVTTRDGLHPLLKDNILKEAERVI